MDWTENEILHFLELYKGEPHLWNSRHPSHKSRAKVCESWRKMAKLMGKPIPVLKSKKNSLMATFRSLRRKKLMSLEDEDTYNPTWFYYQPMEDFLGECYSIKKNPLREPTVTWSETSDEETQDMDDVEIQEEQDIKPDISTLLPASTQDPVSSERQPMSNSVSTPAQEPLTNKRPHSPVITNELHYHPEKISRTARPSTRAPPTDLADDECELYAKLLAIKLRRFPTYERHCLMHEIDGLFLKKRQ